MIEVEILVAESNLTMHRNGTFKKGGLYFARQSKDASCVVVRGEEGYWVPFPNPRGWGILKPPMFSKHLTVYMLNRRRLNEIPDLQEYLAGNNMVSSFLYGYCDRQYFYRQ